jgi:PAS domain S-box-containing protein
MKKLLAKPKNQLSGEYRVKHKKGHCIWVEATGVNHLENPVINAVVGNFNDITLRKNAENYQYLLSALVKSSEDAIVSKTLESIVTSWNKSAEELFGYTPEEIIGKSIRIIIPKDLQKEEDEIIAKLKRGIRVKHFETIRQHKSGKLIPVSLSISPIRDNQNRIIGAAKIARDITKQKQLERAKDDFISIATHELKTPVTSIKAYAQVLEKMFIKKKDATTAEYLKRMDNQLDKLTNLISDLLDVSKIENGKIQFREVFFDLNESINTVVDQMQLNNDKKIVKQLDTSLSVFGDQDRIEQVLINLISNAIKYSPHSDRIIVGTEMKKNDVWICVQDFGVGMPSDK